MDKIDISTPKYPNTFAIVDDENFKYLNQWKWHFTHGYATRNKYIRETQKGKRVSMHRLVNKTPEGLDTDHINRNKLDNRKVNLRTVTRQKNMRNTGLVITNTSGHKGVYKDKQLNKWRAYIKVDAKQIYLGSYTKIEDAVTARKQAEIKYNWL